MQNEKRHALATYIDSCRNHCEYVSMRYDSARVEVRMRIAGMAESGDCRGGGGG